MNGDYIDVASRDSTGDYLVPDVVTDEYISPSDRPYVSIIDDRDSRGDYLHPDTDIDRHSYIQPIEWDCWIFNGAATSLCEKFCANVRTLNSDKYIVQITCRTRHIIIDGQLDHNLMGKTSLMSVTLK